MIIIKIIAKRFSQLWIIPIWIAAKKNIRYDNLWINFQFLNHIFFKEKLLDVNKSGKDTIQAIIHHQIYDDNVQVSWENISVNHSFSKKYQTQCIIQNIHAKIHNSLLKIIIVLNILNLGKMSLKGRINKTTRSKNHEKDQSSL